MNVPTAATSSDNAAAIESEVDDAIALCGGDIRAALRTTLVANAFLEAGLERLSEAVSAGFARGRMRRREKPRDGGKKAG